MTGLKVSIVGAIASLRHTFRSKDIFLHDGAAMRRVHVSSKLQVVLASSALAGLAMSAAGAVQLGVGAPVLANAITGAVGNDAKVATMTAKVASLQAEMTQIRGAAQEHAHRLEARQAMLDSIIAGKGAMPASYPVADAGHSARVDAVLSPLAPVEDRQDQLAGQATAKAQARYRETAAVLNRMGLDPSRFHHVRGAMGGPDEPLPTAASGASDPQFRTLFQSWKRLEQLQRGIVAIPSQRPVDSISFTSGFGVRSDPFRGGAAMHSGVDIPGPIGTPIYATADGMVGRAGWANGYGNLVELEHGKGIQTRYGHLSAVLVAPGSRVMRGQLIARMGSTGRSTGSHLHYEVRLDGRAVNPMPFLQSSNYLLAMQTRARGAKVAMGGPAATE